MDKMPCHITDGPSDPEDAALMWEWIDEEPIDPAEEEYYIQELKAACIIAPMDELTGWSSEYYKLPPDATELQDLIEFKNMNFAVGNIFKAAYRLGNKRGFDELYDLDKIIWFAEREKRRILKQQEDSA